MQKDFIYCIEASTVTLSAKLCTCPYE